LRLPLAGALTMVATTTGGVSVVSAAGKSKQSRVNVIGQLRRAASKPGQLSVTLVLNKLGRKLVTYDRRHGRALIASVAVRFVPAGEALQTHAVKVSVLHRRRSAHGVRQSP
jgi:high-affinity K+ transport system ATPase subunit B